MKSKNIYLNQMSKQLREEEFEGDESAFERFEEIILMFAEDEFERAKEQRDLAYMLAEEAEELAEERLQSFRWFYQRLNGENLETCICDIQDYWYLNSSCKVCSKCICHLREPWDWDESCEVCGKEPNDSTTCRGCGKGGYGDIPCRCDNIESYDDDYYPRWRGLHSEASY
jgi:hypothetical protein